MQILRFWAVAIGLVVLVASCRHRGNRMVISDGDDNLELDYGGDIRFNDSETTIADLSRVGFVAYHHNGDRMLAGLDEKGGW